MYKLKVLLLLVFAISSGNLFSQSTTTSLKEENQVRIFLNVTEKIRCICLPSLPIQSCSFNMCSASAYLKTFIENRIKDGMSESEILQKMQFGFGDSILEDSVVKHFQEQGNSGMVDSLVFGFGEKILARPDGTWINLTLFILGFGGLALIYIYGKGKLKSKSIATSTENGKNSEGTIVNQTKQRSTTEIKEQISKLENSDFT
jgi:cytochrome c-type biogenesis protein CcmH